MSYSKEDTQNANASRCVEISDNQVELAATEFGLPERTELERRHPVLLYLREQYLTRANIARGKLWRGRFGSAATIVEEFDLAEHLASA